MRPIEPASNNARSWARELASPEQWTNALARRVYDALPAAGIVDMWLVEKHPQPMCASWPATPRTHVHSAGCSVCAGLVTAYGDSPHVIAYRLWDQPGDHENAEDYLARHIARASQLLGAEVRL